MSYQHTRSSLLLSITILTNSIGVPIKDTIPRKVLNFEQLHTEQLHFPKEFLFGFAIAEQQNNSGAGTLPGSQWTRWEQTNWPDGTPHIEDGQTSGFDCDHWHRYEDDIALMKDDFNANAFRFSLAWDRIEPREGEFNEEALQHYSDEVDALLEAGIQPMITFHHFCHPNWFEDKGAFEKEANITYFVRYAQRVFEKLGDRVTFWNTINEPTIYVFCGYLPFYCKFPPGKGAGFAGAFRRGLANRVLRNLMQAHTEVYQTLKQMPHGDAAQIGLVHQYMMFETYNTYHLLEKMVPFMLNHFMRDAVIDFLKTGTFDIGTPGLTRHTYTAPEGGLGDFVAINYYSRAVIHAELLRWPPKIDGDCREGEVMTDMEYPIYPQGLYHALHHMAEIGLPIYITENGIADSAHKDDWRRVRWIKEYLKSVSLAIEDGLDIRGYFYWTLMDNFEWNRGNHSQFGLYTKDRILKDGGLVYADIVKATRRGDLAGPTEDRLPKEAVTKVH